MRLTPAIIATALLAAAPLTMTQLAKAADLQIVSGGAFKQVLTPLAAQYEKESGDKPVSYTHLDVYKRQSSSTSFSQ